MLPIEKIGEWAFLLGVLTAVVAGLASGAFDTAWAGYVTLALVVFGLIVGFLNVGDMNVNNFLIAAVAIVLIGTAKLTAIPVVGTYLALMVLNVSAFVAPAALVVALKSVYAEASKPKKKK
jgi:hypothetical protein